MSCSCLRALTARTPWTPPLPPCQVTSREQLLQCLLDGLRARATAATYANAHSSRSHAVFTIRVRQTARRLVVHQPPDAATCGAAPCGFGGAGGGGAGSGAASGAPQSPRAAAVRGRAGAAAGVAGGGGGGGGGDQRDAPRQQRFDYVEETLEARLHLVDLAGSERLGRYGAQGARLLEACSINQVGGWMRGREAVAAAYGSPRAAAWLLGACGVYMMRGHAHACALHRFAALFCARECVCVTFERRVRSQAWRFPNLLRRRLPQGLLALGNVIEALADKRK